MSLPAWRPHVIDLGWKEPRIVEHGRIRRQSDERYSPEVLARNLQRHAAKLSGSGLGGTWESCRAVVRCEPQCPRCQAYFQYSRRDPACLVWVICYWCNWRGLARFWEEQR